MDEEFSEDIALVPDQDPLSLDGHEFFLANVEDDGEQLENFQEFNFDPFQGMAGEVGEREGEGEEEEEGEEVEDEEYEQDAEGEVEEYEEYEEQPQQDDVTDQRMDDDEDEELEEQQSESSRSGTGSTYSNSVSERGSTASESSSRTVSEYGDEDAETEGSEQDVGAGFHNGRVDSSSGASTEGDEEEPQVQDEDAEEEEEEADSAPPEPKKRRVVKNVEYFAHLHIDSYLQRRGFNMYDTSQLTVNLGQLVEDMKETYQHHSKSQVNVVACGANYDTDGILTELERFWGFYQVMKQEDEVSSQSLKPMLMPILAYFFRDCIIQGLLEEAAKIFTTFSQKFYGEVPTRENHCLLTLLANYVATANFEDLPISGQPFMVHLKEALNKLQFVVNPWVFDKIQGFADQAKVAALAHLLSQEFVISVENEEEEDPVVGLAVSHTKDITNYQNVATPDKEERQSDWMDGDGPGRENKELNEDGGPNEVINQLGITADNRAGGGNKNIPRKISRMIHRLRGSVEANVPTILVYKTNGSATCGEISMGGSMIAYGMERGGVRVFSAPPTQRGFTSQIRYTAEEIGTIHTSKTLNGHAGDVNDLAFHPKARYIFTAGEDKVMRLWDAKNNICRSVYRGHHCPIWSVDVSGSGNMVATGSMDTTARLWVPECTTIVRSFAGHYFDVDVVKFHPNEGYLATASVDKSVRFWSIDSGNMVRMLTGSKGAINCLAFHKNGRHIAAAGEDELIRIWDLGEGKLLNQIQAAPGCQDLSFSNDMLAAGFANGNVTVYNTRDLLSGNMNLDSDTVQRCRSKTFQTEVNSIVKLYYKSPSVLLCLGSVVTSTASKAGTST